MIEHYVGRYRDEALGGKYRGWIVGSFVKEEDKRKTRDVEIKYWEFPVGSATHDYKISETLESTIILQGKVEGYVGTTRTVLSEGEYIVFKAGIENNIVELVRGSAKGFTIKAPSEPSAKQVIKKDQRGPLS